LGQNNTYIKHHDLNITINSREPKIKIYGLLDVFTLAFISINVYSTIIIDQNTTRKVEVNY